VYYYLFDTSTDPREQQRITQIKSTLTSLGIAGELASLDRGKHIGELVQRAVDKRYSTLVAVGGSSLLQQLVNAIPYGELVVGAIPLSNDPILTQFIGTNDWKVACELLRKRRWHDTPSLRANGIRTPFDLIGELGEQGQLLATTKQWSTRIAGGQVVLHPEDGHVQLSINSPQPRSLFGGKSPQQTTLLTATELSLQSDVIQYLRTGTTEIAALPTTIQHDAVFRCVRAGE
jgi:hypothetical protein